MESLAQLCKQGEFLLKRLQLLETGDIKSVTPDILINILAASTNEIIAQAKRAHVDASNPESYVPPQTLSDHRHLSSTDKVIWDRAYLHEYFGLHEDEEAWGYITEQEYKELHPITGNALPSMVITTIKRDKNGPPKRAKYRIVYIR